MKNIDLSGLDEYQDAVKIVQEKMKETDESFEDTVEDLTYSDLYGCIDDSGFIEFIYASVESNFSETEINDSIKLGLADYFEAERADSYFFIDLGTEQACFSNSALSRKIETDVLVDDSHPDVYTYSDFIKDNDTGEFNQVISDVKKYMAESLDEHQYDFLIEALENNGEIDADNALSKIVAPVGTQSVLLFQEENKWLIRLNDDIPADSNSMDKLIEMKETGEFEHADLLDYSHDVMHPDRGDESDGITYEDQIDCLIDQIKERNPELSTTPTSKRKMAM